LLSTKKTGKREIKKIGLVPLTAERDDFKSKYLSVKKELDEVCVCVFVCACVGARMCMYTCVSACVLVRVCVRESVALGVHVRVWLCGVGVCLCVYDSFESKYVSTQKVEYDVYVCVCVRGKGVVGSMCVFVCMYVCS